MGGLVQTQNTTTATANNIVNTVIIRANLLHRKTTSRRIRAIQGTPRFLSYLAPFQSVNVERRRQLVALALARHRHVVDAQVVGPCHETARTNYVTLVRLLGQYARSRARLPRFGQLNEIVVTNDNVRIYQVHVLILAIQMTAV